MPSLPPEIQLQRLANAYQLSRAVQVAARLGLGRLLAEAPRSAPDIAAATATDPAVLARLLRFLAEIGVVSELPGGHFAGTPLSERLHLVDNIAQGEEAWMAWGALPEALRSGRSVFSRVHGRSFYDYAADHPAQEGNWQEWNRRQAAALAPALAEGLRLRGGETVVDVGGGSGAVLAAILLRHPTSHGVLLDLPSVVRRAPDVLRRAGVLERCTLVAGDGLRDVPAGGDIYLLCRVLFNSDDAGAVRMLRHCRRAMRRGARLVVVEPLMPEPGEPQRGALAGADLHHFLLWGGALRSRAQMEALCTTGGLALAGVRQTSPDAGWWLLEAHPAGTCAVQD